MQEIILKIYFERRLSKSLKETLFFLSNPVPFNRQDFYKQKRPGTLPVKKTSPEKFLY